MLWECFDGSRHPVSENFLKIVPVELSGVPFERIESERIETLNKPDILRLNARIKRTGIFPNLEALGQETMDDVQRLRALDSVINMNRAYQMLDGRDYRSHNELFGPKGTLCQVHHNTWRPLHCGCEMPFIFDHWLREKPDQIIVYPHHYGMRRCERHVHIGDYADAFYTVQRENRARTYADMKAQERV